MTNSNLPPEDPWQIDDESANKASTKTNSSTEKENVFGKKKSAPAHTNPIDKILDELKSNFQDKFDSKIKDFSKRTSANFGGGGNANNSNSGNNGNQPPQSFKILWIAGCVVVAWWLASGFYKVDEGEVGVVMRFGAFSRTAAPGLRYRLPSPIENEIITNVAVINKIDSSKSEDNDQSLILTGDENMVLTNYTVLWKIKDINQYLFKVRNPDSTIKVAAESAIREVVGQASARLALTEGREKIGDDALKLLQKILDMYQIGVQIISFQLQRVEPPAQVVEAFNDMQASLVDADRLQNEAQAYSNDILPKARGQAQKTLRAAEADGAQSIAQAEGETSKFNSIYAAYKLNPTIASIRMHRETMEYILKNSKLTVMDDQIAKSLHNYSQIATVPAIATK